MVHEDHVVQDGKIVKPPVKEGVETIVIVDHSSSLVFILLLLIWAA